MRSRSLVPLLALAVGFALVVAPARAQDTRPGIAVLPFNNSGSFGQDKENFDALQKGIAGMLISELAANPAARVVEREQIQSVLYEHHLGPSGQVGPKTAASAGKLRGPPSMSPGTFIH